MKNTSRRLKGFTLIELIIVLAIIGVLAAILVPTMATFYMKSRIKSSNSDAKMVYNAAQTEAQKYIAIDRTFLDNAKKSGLGSTFVLAYYPDNSFACGNTANTDLLAGKKAISTAVTPTEQAAVRVIEAVNKTVSGSDSKCWAIYVQNYIVKGCIAADSTATNLVGYYTSGKTIASERSSQIFEVWLQNGTVGDPIDCLADVGGKYGT